MILWYFRVVTHASEGARGAAAAGLLPAQALADCSSSATSPSPSFPSRRSMHRQPRPIRSRPRRRAAAMVEDAPLTQSAEQGSRGGAAWFARPPCRRHGPSDTASCANARTESIGPHRCAAGDGRRWVARAEPLPRRPRRDGEDRAPTSPLRRRALLAPVLPPPRGPPAGSGSSSRRRWRR
jgi:hypothetical protein